MADHESTNGNGTGSDDRDLAADLDDWVFAGRGLFRVVERLSRLIPPFGADRAAELAQLISASHAEFTRVVANWQTFIRPALDRHADYPPRPGWLIAGTGAARYEPKPPPVLDSAVYADGFWVEQWATASAGLLDAVDNMRECIPPADEAVAWSLTSFHIPRVDERFDWLVDGYRKAVRPRLKPYERRARR